jgi:hypothetical protein
MMAVLQLGQDTQAVPTIGAVWPGKITMEATRAPQRHLSDVFDKQLAHDAERGRRHTDPRGHRE